MGYFRRLVEGQDRPNWKPGGSHPEGSAVRLFDFSSARADEFHDRYDPEHIPERLRVAGFSGSCRLAERMSS
jgi:hypothetical protein